MRPAARKILVYSAGSLFGAVILSYLLFLGYASLRESGVNRAWTESGRPMKEFGDALPREVHNESARKLEGIVERLGISLVPVKSREMPAATAWDFAEANFRHYLETQIEDPTPLIEPPPEELLTFLRRHGEVLAELRAHLETEEIPRWEVDPYRSDGSPVHFLAILYVQECLIVDALVGFQEGDRERTLSNLESAWVLVRALSERPDLHAQDAVVAMVRIQAGVLRKLDGLPPVWKERMAIEGYERALLRAFQLEAWGYWVRGEHLSRIPFYRRQNRRERIFWRTFGRAWYRLAMADISRRYLDEMLTLESLNACVGDYRTPMQDIIGSVPSWSALSKGRLLNFGIYWERAELLKVDLELTSKVLEVRGIHESNGGTWPEFVPGIEHSACPQTRWIYQSTDDGGMSLVFSRAGTVQKLARRILLPLRFDFPAVNPPPA